MKITYGYARVSTVSQTLQAQLDGLKAAWCQRIFREKVSGARADRRELNKLLRRLDAGDVVVARGVPESRSNRRPKSNGSAMVV